jgi:hypothetical protein
MNIEHRNLAEITPYDRNPRQNEPAVEAVARSIAQFGWRQPIVVEQQNVIVVGHTRYKAAQRLGLTAVPVHVATDLTPEQIRAYRIADNKLAELAAGDLDLLPEELAASDAAQFDLDLLGFSEQELAQLLREEIAPGHTDPDELPEPPDEPITCPGDLWILGDHRLLCGDSGKPEDVDRLLGGATAQLVNTDPPYNVRVKPRSNNAIAAGLSSFPGTRHHQRFDQRRLAGRRSAAVYRAGLA